MRDRGRLHPGPIAEGRDRQPRGGDRAEGRARRLQGDRDRTGARRRWLRVRRRQRAGDARRPSARVPARDQHAVARRRRQGAGLVEAAMPTRATSRGSESRRSASSESCWPASLPTWRSSWAREQRRHPGGSRRRGPRDSLVLAHARTSVFMPVRAPRTGGTGRARAHAGRTAIAASDQTRPAMIEHSGDGRTGLGEVTWSWSSSLT